MASFQGFKRECGDFKFNAPFHRKRMEAVLKAMIDVAIVLVFLR